jgi:type II secretory pathway pseudopilin PulG
LELGFAVVGIAAASLLRILYQRINTKREEQMTGNTEAANLTAEEMSALGDRSPAFRYKL